MKSSGPGFPPHPELFSVCVLLLLVQRETGRQGGYLGGDGFLLRLKIKGAGRDPFAIFRISSGPKPRVVTAGVPMRTPEVTKGFSGSLGTVFCLL